VYPLATLAAMSKDVGLLSANEVGNNPRLGASKDIRRGQSWQRSVLL